MIFSFDEYELDMARLQLHRSGRLLKLDSSALRLLGVLLSRPGESIRKDELMEKVWQDRPVADNVITVAMARLRKALVPGRGGSEFITTVYGIGYRFDRPVQVREAAPFDSVEAAEAPPAAPLYVGRARVLARLHEALHEAGAGRGRVCVLMGEPGIGKTRAVEVLEQELAGGPVRVAWGHCREAGETPPLWPWQELLRQITGAHELALSGGATSTDPAAKYIFSAAPLLSPTPSGFEGASPDAARYIAFEHILSTFTAATKQAPWLLVLDDLHRADAASIELLSHLADRVARTHILLVATLRPAELGGAARPDTALSRILGHRNCERITLERLSQSEVAGYVAAFLDQAGVSPATRLEAEAKLARLVHDKSEGNPFFMVELLRQVRDADELSTETLALPAAALDLVRQRVVQIDAETRGLLSQCAVIGRSFELSLLAELTQATPAALRLALDAALRAEVLLRGPETQTTYTFGHELMRAVLYESCSAGERRELHKRVGEALLRRRLAGHVVTASDLAYHFYAALPLGDLRTTVRVCREAAEAAASVFGSTDVAHYTRRALEALQLMARPSVKLRMSLLYVTAIYSRGDDTRSFMRCLDQLLRLAREHADGEMLARAGALMDAHFALQPVGGAAAPMELALAHLPPEGQGLRALALAGLAAAAPHCYDVEQCTQRVDQAAELARSADSLGAMYMALLHQLHLVGGAAHDERAVRAAEQLEQMAQRHPVELAALPVDLAFYRAGQALAAGAPQQAKVALERALARSRQLHHRELVWHCERNLALLGLELGEGPLARDALSLLHEQAERANIVGSDLLCAYDRAVLRGPSEQIEPLSEADSAALQLEAEDLPMFWALKLRAWACAGVLEVARAGLHRLAPEQLLRLPLDSQYLGTLGHLTHVAVMLDEASYYPVLRQLLQDHRTRYALDLFASYDGAVTGPLGVLAHACGQTQLAITTFEQAIVDNQRAGFVVRAAEASLWLARCLVEQGEPSRIPQAMSLARGVRNSSSRMGMLQLGRKAAAFLTTLASD